VVADKPRPSPQGVAAVRSLAGTWCGHGRACNPDNRARRSHFGDCRLFTGR